MPPASPRPVAPSAQDVLVKTLVQKLIGLVAIGGCAVFAVGGLFLLAKLAGPTKPATPERAAFQAASNHVLANSGQVAFGNDPRAQSIAARFGERLQALREAAFTGAEAEQERASLTRGRFLVHCQLAGDEACFLVHVPQLKNYRGDVREALLDLAWNAGREATRQAGVRRLGVGLRGAVLYGAIAVGQASQARPELFECAGSVGTEPLEAFFADKSTVSPAATPAAAQPKGEGRGAQPAPEALQRESPSSKEALELAGEGGGKFVRTQEGEPAYQIDWLDEEGELARHYGLRQGDRVLSVNGQPVAEGEDILDQLESEGGGRYAVAIERGGSLLVLSSEGE